MENKPIYSDNDLSNLIRSYMDQNPRGGGVIEIARMVRDVVENKIKGLSLEGVLAESVPWSEATFPKATVSSITTHLLREWREMINSGFNDSEEYADVVLLMAHLAYRKHFDLGSSIRHKFEINKARTWGEVDEEGVVEHVRELPVDADGFVIAPAVADDPPYGPNVRTVHFMKIGPNGEPYAIEATEQNAHFGMTTFAPPVYPTYRANIVEGQVVFEKMVYQNHSGGEHRWVEVDKNSTQRADFTMRSKLMELLDIGVIPPIQLSVQTTMLGELLKPILNERWETVVETSKGELTGRKGRVRSYRQGGKEFVREIVWDE